MPSTGLDAKQNSDELSAGVAEKKKAGYTVHGRPESAGEPAPELVTLEIPIPRPAKQKLPDVDFHQNGSEAPVKGSILFEFHEDDKLSVSVKIKRDERGKRTVMNKQLLRTVMRPLKTWAKPYRNYLNRAEKA